MRPALACLTATIRHFFHPQSPLPAPLTPDWPQLLALAGQHSIIPILFHATPNPPETLRQRALHAARSNLRLSAKLAALLAAFEQARIPVLPLKGPILAETLYGCLALRSFSDLDLLVHPGDLLHAKRLLELNGYHLRSTLHWPTDSACFRYRDKELTFSDAEALTFVDLHWSLLPGYFPPAFDDAEIWPNLRATSFAGLQTLALQPEHLLLFLCAHGTKHLWVRLGWLCDVARLLQIVQNLNWPLIFSQAEKTGTSRILNLSLQLASDLLWAELPPQVRQRIASDPKARSLAKTLAQRLARGIPGLPTGLEPVLFSLRAFERTSHRLHYLFGSLVQPSEAEYKALKLPPILHWLYYFIRPIRLLAKHGVLALKILGHKPSRKS